LHSKIQGRWPQAGGVKKAIFTYKNTEKFKYYGIKNNQFFTKSDPKKIFANFTDFIVQNSYISLIYITPNKMLYFLFLLRKNSYL